MIFIFTGNGKGKTTAALGQAVRVLGNGKRVALIQFIKSPKWSTGEEAALKRFGRQCKIYKGGKGFVGIMGDKLPRSAHKAAARKTWQEAKKCIKSGRFGLVILDEINVAVSLRLLSEKEVLCFLTSLKRLRKRGQTPLRLGIAGSDPAMRTDIILTGRSAPKEFLKIADLVTEFKEIKHPFQKGTWGEKGREY